MSPLVILIEIIGMSTILCALHAVRKQLGSAPFYFVVGLLEVFLFVSGKGDAKIMSAMFWSEPTHVSTPLFLSGLLGAMTIVYILEGTRNAQRFLVAMFAIYVFHGIVDWVLFLHASNPPAGTADLSDTTLVAFSQWARFSSFCAIMADFITMAVVYQATRNVISKLPLGLSRLPLKVPIFIAMVCAMAMDVFAYSLVQGEIVGTEGFRFIPKMQAAIAAGLPLAVYVQWQLSRRTSGEASLLLDRGALEILDLRARVAEIEARLQEQREQYAYVKSTFSKYVSSELADTLLSDPSKVQLGGEARDVTILFADVRGYSTLAESMAPSDLIKMLNEYLARMSEVIFKHHGMINEFEGDGILAVFGAPVDLPDHAECAVSAGEEMLETVVQINHEWETSGLLDHWRAVGIDKLAIRIGIHSGTVVAGNIGTDQRMKYAVIGDTVNTAARIEALNKELDTSLLMSTPTMSKLSRAHNIEGLGAHKVKGKADTVEVFTVGKSA